MKKNVLSALVIATFVSSFGGFSSNALASETINSEIAKSTNNLACYCGSGSGDCQTPPEKENTSFSAFTIVNDKAKTTNNLACYCGSGSGDCQTPPEEKKD